MKLLVAILFFLLPLFRVSGQQDNIGSGRSLHFDGIDDYVDLGNVYDDLDFPLSISAWIYVDKSQVSPIFASQDNSPTYNGFQFVASATTLAIEYGDGRGENDPAFRRSKGQNIPSILNRWVHVAAVIKSISEMELYLNGIDIGGAYTGSTPFGMNSNFPGDVAKIGYWHSNGMTLNFGGSMDELRIWNRALSESEIRQTMCKKLKGNEAGLIGYWTFNETSGNSVLDKSSVGFNGEFVNGPTRIFSGAPIGDESSFEYSLSWSGKDFSMQYDSEGVRVANLSDFSGGVHVYVVKDLPSQTIGLDLNDSAPPYFGVFTASIISPQFFDVRYLPESLACNLFSREDNSVANWIENTSVIQNVIDRIELIKKNDNVDNFTVNLGSDRIVCDQSSVDLSIGIDPLGKTILWNSGATTPVIVATQTGMYSVTVSKGCNIDRDTIHLIFMNAPPVFSLGENVSTCSLKPLYLSPTVDQTAYYDFTWQDGSKANRFLVTAYGTYWLTLENPCGTSSDTIQFVKDFSKPPFVFSLGENDTLCVFKPRNLAPDIDMDDGYDFIWQDGSISKNFQVTDFGTYWLKLINDCGTSSDSIHIVKRNPDEIIISNFFSPNGDIFNQYFEIPEILKGSRLQVFNRWGDSVYQSSSYQNTWDGTGLPSGVYFYLLRGECIIEKKGSLTLIR